MFAKPNRIRLITCSKKKKDNVGEMRFYIYLNANESKCALIIDELSSKVGEIAADSLAANLIALELEHRPI